MLPWPYFVSFCDSLMLCVFYCELCDMTAPGVRAHILFLVSADVGTVSPILWNQSSYSLNPCSRLRRWVLHEAHGHSSVPEEPPAHQRDPERECGARRPLCGHHSQNAGPETPGSVFNGSSGKEKGCGCS